MSVNFKLVIYFLILTSVTTAQDKGLLLEDNYYQLIQILETLETKFQSLEAKPHGKTGLFFLTTCLSFKQRV